MSALDEEQLEPLFEIARFSLDGQLAREELESNPRYAEIALFGAAFLATTDVARNAVKLASLRKGPRYARAGAMGALQAKTKTCFLMIQNELP